MKLVLLLVGGLFACQAMFTAPESAAREQQQAVAQQQDAKPAAGAAPPVQPAVRRFPNGLFVITLTVVVIALLCPWPDGGGATADVGAKKPLRRGPRTAVEALAAIREANQALATFAGPIPPKVWHVRLLAGRASVNGEYGVTIFLCRAVCNWTRSH